MYVILEKMTTEPSGIEWWKPIGYIYHPIDAVKVIDEEHIEGEIQICESADPLCPPFSAPGCGWIPIATRIIKAGLRHAKRNRRRGD